MHKFFSFAIFLLVAAVCMAQVSKTDSLKKVMDNHPEKDTVHVINIFKYAISLSNENPYKAIEILNNTIPVAKELQWNRGLINLYMILSGMQTRKERYDESIVNLLEALKIAEATHIERAYVSIHYELSESYRLMRDFKQAGIHAQKALAISIAEKNEQNVLYATTILAGVYEDRNMWDSAAPLLDKAMDMATRLNNEYFQQQIISHKADHLISINDREGALKLYKQNLAFQIKTDEKAGIAWVYSVLSRLYTQLNNKDSAYHYANQALAMSVKYNLTKELKDSYETLYECHYKFGNYKKALEFRLIFDSIYNATNSLAAGQNIERAKIELEQQKKDAVAKTEQLKKEAEVAKVRNLEYTALAVFAVALLFLFLNNRQKQRGKRKIEKAYNELKSTQQLLIQSEKMASLGELTTGIAHEIQNPLNFVNNFSEVSTELVDEMNEELNKGDIEEAKAIANDVKLNLEKINLHGKRAGDIVKGMLAHSRTSSGQKELTDINNLCDEYLRLSYHGLRAKDKNFNAKFETDFDKSIQKINIVPQDIGRAILNLITNAFYAAALPSSEKSGINSGGGLAPAYKHEPTIWVKTSKIPPLEGGGTLISVRDNGPGIPANIIDKIFQPFFTTKPTGQGTGLGLSLAYDIVKAHGGNLTVETKEGEGSNFIISLTTT